MDATFEFEKRRNRPVRYDRTLVSTTLRAMKRVEEIQSAREKRHHTRRMALSNALRVRQDEVELAKGVHLLAPAEKRVRRYVRSAARFREAARSWPPQPRPPSNDTSSKSGHSVIRASDSARRRSVRSSSSVSVPSASRRSVAACSAAALAAPLAAATYAWSLRSSALARASPAACSAASAASSSE